MFSAGKSNFPLSTNCISLASLAEPDKFLTFWYSSMPINNACLVWADWANGGLAHNANIETRLHSNSTLFIVHFPFFENYVLSRIQQSCRARYLMLMLLDFRL